ncbi:acetylornithine aminotransferase apoenzyme [Anoxybacillus pushchinoensis]|uniref:Acetylornithine aminotransferase n=1 Tax=Anoxybacillus pushchinoensis TaxID=150248 RepID=A0A1I0T228_9BACL|nr:acetylornithine transaminase [Anoxybacillus pushchinoensis]SFA45737.1 acetylornithine aminotransferase apoenzyme [Anoxybacillus pushchinoensis]
MIFPTYQRFPITVAKAEGTKIIATDGKQYIDFIAGIAVCNLGHRHPAVQQALAEQLNEVWHVSNLFHLPLQEEVASLLVQHSVGDAVFFCNSGAEANEAAIKLARKHTGRSKIITCEQSFHGRTFATMSATGQAKIHDGFGPLLPTFAYVPFNDIDALEKEMDETVAAVMVEVVQGEGGVVVGEKSFLQAAEQLCQTYGALLIVDEVQTGIGRTGTLFAYEQFHISPDVITVAKGLGSGFPVGAMIGKKHVIPTFSAGVHGSTFGGNALAMAAAKATLNIVTQPSFLQDVREKGTYFHEQLKKVLEHIHIVTHVRGLGLMVGIACNEQVTNILPHIHERGLLVLAAGPNVIRLLPPLTVTKEEIDEAVNILQEALTSYERDFLYV